MCGVMSWRRRWVMTRWVCRRWVGEHPIPSEEEEEEEEWTLPSVLKVCLGASFEEQDRGGCGASVSEHCQDQWT